MIAKVHPDYYAIETAYFIPIIILIWVYSIWYSVLTLLVKPDFPDQTQPTGKTRQCNATVSNNTIKPHEPENLVVRHAQAPDRPRRWMVSILALVVVTFTSVPGAISAQTSSSSTDMSEPLNLVTCVRQALVANPDLQSRLSTLEATRADLVVARSVYYPTLDLSGSAARSGSSDAGTVDRHDLGLSLQQSIYRGGRSAAGTDVAAAALAVDEAAVASARADLILAVRQAWYRLAQADRLVLSTEEALKLSRLNLEFAEAQLSAGLTTRPDVLRARVDVSAVELVLTRSRNTRDGARALLNTLLGRPPSTALEQVPGSEDDPLPSLPDWTELRQTALDARDEVQLSRARTDRHEAELRLARGVFLPTVNANAGLNRGGTSSLSPRESWSIGMQVAMPLFEGFAPTARLQAREALLEASRHDEQTIIQQIEREVWDALLAEGESATRLENARTLLDATRENLDAALESYRLGLGSMIALVDARTTHTNAEQTYIQAIFDRHIARAVLDRALGIDISI